MTASSDPLAYTGQRASGEIAGSVTKLDDEFVLVRRVRLSNSQIKNMRATPVTLVPKPGVGKILKFMGAVLKLKAGTNVLTESADNMAVRFTDGSGALVSQAIEATGFIDQAANTYTTAEPKIDVIVAQSAANNALVLHNTGDGEYAGNAANDATMIVEVRYVIAKI